MVSRIITEAWRILVEERKVGIASVDPIKHAYRVHLWKNLKKHKLGFLHVRRVLIQCK